MKSLLRGGAAAAIVLALSGCGTMMVTGAIVGTTVAAGTIVTKTAVGAGTLAVKGTGAVVRGTGRAVRLVAGREEGDQDD